MNIAYNQININMTVVLAFKYPYWTRYGTHCRISIFILSSPESLEVCFSNTLPTLSCSPHTPLFFNLPTLPIRSHSFLSTRYPISLKHLPDVHGPLAFAQNEGSPVRVLGWLYSAEGDTISAYDWDIHIPNTADNTITFPLPKIFCDPQFILYHYAAYFLPEF